ncbi:MAG: 5-formyltetrahydrofolate cyclo-ligase [Bdellovibrionales bacterium]
MSASKITDLQLNKKDLRMNYRFRRSNMAAGARSRATKLIGDSLLEIISNYPGATIAGYRSIDSELNLDQFYKEALKTHSLVFPKVEQDILSFYKVNSMSEFQTGSFGVLEPLVGENSKHSLENIDLILVPGIAFDKKGNRLGWGKAFYDKTLNCNTVLKLGVGFQCQVVEKLPVDSWDRRMDLIVTESDTIELGKEDKND